MLNLIAVPSLIGFLIKIYFIWISRSSISKNNFSALLLICTLHSFCEFLTLTILSSGVNVELLFRMYYVLIIWWFGYSFVYTSEIAGIKDIYSKIVIAATSILSLFLLISDFLISGYHNTGVTITADREEYYLIAPIFVLTMCLSSIAILIKIKLSKSSEPEKKLKAHYLLLALLVPIATIVVVIICLLLHLQLNATIIFPVATTIFCLFIIKSERKHKLSDILRFNPFSAVSKFSNEMNHIAKKLASDEISIKELKDQSERAAVNYALSISKNKTIAEISKERGIPASTLYRLLDKHGIKIK